MRKMLALLTAFSVGVVGTIPVPVFAQQAAAVAAAARPIDPLVLATFNAYRAGGPALAERIRTLILQSNNLASDVARAITTNGLLNPRQRAAGQDGLVQALSRLGATPEQLQPVGPTGGPDSVPAVVANGPPAAPGGLVDQVPSGAGLGGLSDGQWVAIVTALAVGGGALGVGIYETTKKKPVTTPVSPN